MGQCAHIEAALGKCSLKERAVNRFAMCQKWL
jgi:hypothetical protein